MPCWEDALRALNSSLSGELGLGHRWAGTQGAGDEGHSATDRPISLPKFTWCIFPFYWLCPKSKVSAGARGHEVFHAALLTKSQHLLTLKDTHSCDPCPTERALPKGKVVVGNG